MYQANSQLLTTESVSEGHPDKIADQIAEAVCDFCLEQDSNARVACEVFVDSKVIFIGGEISSSLFKLDDQFKRKIKQIVQTVVKDRIGFNATTWNFFKRLNNDDSSIEIRLHQQSEEINDLVRSNGAGDNSTVFGFANSDLNYFPVFQHLANKILQKISQIRKDNQHLQKEVFSFAPDAKVQILFDNVSRVVKQITLCQQFKSKLTNTQKKFVSQKIKTEIIEPLFQDLKLKRGYLLILKDFKKGGPNADSGLTGRKLLVDNYGVFSTHGGGSFAGKDPSKTDRSLALFARFIAKHLVASGLTKVITLQVSSLIGESKLVNITPVTTDPETDLVKINDVIKNFFMWDVKRIVSELKLNQIKFFPFASYGYFGRSDLESSWEKLTYLSQIQTWIQKNTAAF